MKRLQKKELKAISLMDVQAELMRELARENVALANDTLELVRQFRESLDYAKRIASVPIRAQVAKTKVIPFPVRCNSIRCDD